MTQNAIRVVGAREHNLKNLTVEIPRDKLVVITGLSGSGKSSLAFDTIFAEGQRRYVESLSAYARQFLGQMNKPDVDTIEGLSPAVSIDQKGASHNPRSTVGTVTEVYDYLRLLYARAGIPHCPLCGREVARQSAQEIVDAIEALRKVHEANPGTTLVMGGYHSTFAAEKILRDYPFVDYVIKGEAERAFPDLLDRLESGTSAADVEGITFVEDGRAVSQPLAVIQDLDALPFPDRSLLGDLEYGYFHQNIRLTYGKFTTIVTSRGCPYACTYCSCAAFSQRHWRARSATDVADELEGLHDQGYENVVFVDDNFTLKKSRVTELCEEIRRRKIRMRFYCEGRVDNAPYELLRTMKRAGFDVMYFGVESPTPGVLDYYKKHNLIRVNAKKNQPLPGM